MILSLRATGDCFVANAPGNDQYYIMPKQNQVLKKDKFFEKIESLGLALSYGDVRLKTSYSEIVPQEVNLTSRFSRNVPLKTPLVSSPMDMITERKMAIALALAGGLGVIHRALNPKDQAKEVSRVKFYLNGLIEKPICVKNNETIKNILTMAASQGYAFHSFPVIDLSGRLAGLISNHDIEFCSDHNLQVGQVMTKAENLITAPSGISLKEAFVLMQKTKKKILPLVDKQNRLSGMYRHHIPRMD